MYTYHNNAQKEYFQETLNKIKNNYFVTILL